MNLKRNRNILKYNTKAKSIYFWCSGVDENKEATTLFDDFLFDLQKDRNVFLYAYRLPYEHYILDEEEIVSKAEILLDPFHTYFYLREAKVKSNYFHHACEATIYYFDKKVSWVDFLATSNRIVSSNSMSSKLIKQELLFARFSSLDYSADFWFECSKNYENKIQELFVGMSNLGWEIKKSIGLNFYI